MIEQQYKILIVDDEKEIVTTYRDYFLKRGFEVDIAYDGIEGLKKLRGDEFHVAILDIKMPKMNGIQVARRVQEEGIDTDVIILTGHGDRDDAIEAININVRAWFDKSGIKMNDLLAKVKEAAEVIPLNEVRRILSSIPDQKPES